MATFRSISAEVALLALLAACASAATPGGGGDAQSVTAEAVTGTADAATATSGARAGTGALDTLAAGAPPVEGEPNAVSAGEPAGEAGPPAATPWARAGTAGASAVNVEKSGGAGGARGLSAQALTVDGGRAEGTLFVAAVSDSGAESTAGPVAFQVEKWLSARSAAPGRRGDRALVPLSEIARVRLASWGSAAPLVSGVVTRSGSEIRGPVSVVPAARGGAAERRRTGSGAQVGAAAGSAAGGKALLVVDSARLGEVRIGLGEAAAVLFDCRGGLPAAGPRGVLFRNGDFLEVSSLAFEAEGISVECELGKLDLPLERVAAARLGPVARPSAGAAVVLENGDRLFGRLVAASAERLSVKLAAAGVDASGPDRQARLAGGGAQGGAGEVSRGVSGGGAAAARAGEAAAGQSAAGASGSDSEGSSGAGSSAGGGGRVVEVAADDVFEIYWPQRCRRLAELELSAEPAWFAPEGEAGAFVDHGPQRRLEGAGRAYRTGLFLRSGSSVSVRLPRGALRLVFTAEVARGSRPREAVFEVRSGDRRLWSAKVEAGRPEGGARGREGASVPRAAGAPEPVVLDVSGLVRVELSVRSEPPGLPGVAGVWGDALVTISQEE